MENAAQPPHTKCYSLFDQAQLSSKSTFICTLNERTRSACRHDELAVGGDDGHQLTRIKLRRVDPIRTGR
jgi:hypothetical protein